MLMELINFIWDFYFGFQICIPIYVLCFGFIWPENFAFTIAFDFTPPFDFTKAAGIFYVYEASASWR